MSKPKKGKKFKYSLETLLKVRDIKKKEAEQKLQKAEKALQEEEYKEQQRRDEQTAHYQYFQELLGSEDFPGIHVIQMNQQHLKTMEERVNEQIKQTKEAEKKRDEKRQDAVKATQDKKVIEKDKEKTKVLWRKMMGKIDAQFLDELSSIKFASKKIDEADDPE